MPTAKVLVIEDNPMNMELATDLLRLQGCEVLQAVTAFEALDLLREVTPDLILMDIQLPGLNGLALTRDLREDPRTKDIPIIAITAYAMLGDEEKAVRAGCNAYIPKPIETTKFFQVVGEVLGRRHG
ncbi:MAG: response regulator [candidate division NC10 bacterium]|nr:response regulator [candidate division NC10 bacterium]MBI3085466.1 response regulator [candidate division NC10 bacterium]